MTTTKMVTGWFFGLGFVMVLACSSNQGPSGRADSGAGGGGGTEGVQFRCAETVFCTVAEYCRDLSSPGGASGTLKQHTFSCVNFGDCAARDCSCVPQNCGLYGEGTCNQADGGGTLATCDQG